ncbi:leucine/isoleucine/valine transporter ATP-binding subunit [Bradyrhizobium sp. LTSP885]|uniref:ABC transporter ATP-binding protein n=1 Tax=Bradyrhizobium sp. LTSP885 TaxID=1619232 RepID=UPI0005C84357|nr:ABC transporter ATP-binding protein [Bradyrhizobium sp. LTSP885]KJC48705.1 leucine/isoleucine/valine transporter ATP-binding subunit [Bradyrhizobium sp. LTSP885]
MAEAPDTPCLAVNGLVTGYDARNVLTGVSLSLKSGELVTVVGPNGHGKSTLLRAISGLLPVRKGSVSLNGNVISGLPAHRVAANGVIHVPQGDLLFAGMSVLENLLMGAYLDSDRAAVTRRLDEVFTLLPKLAERQTQIAASLSGGERRMVGIGRGLMMKGTVMLIDEPSLGLAPIIIEQIYDVITRLKASGRTILLVEENPARVADIADRIHLLDNGAFVWSGEPAVLLERDELLATYLGG